MCGVMEHVIADVSEHQACKHGRGQATENHKKHTVKEKCQGNTHDRRHNKSARVVGIIMMHSMDHVMQSFSPSSLRFIMKYEPMNEIFEQGPEQDSQQE